MHKLVNLSSMQSVNNSIIYVTDNIDLKGQALPSVTNYLEVMGNCPNGCCWIDAHLLSQVFIITANGHFTSHDFEIRNGKAEGCGGAVWVASGGHAGFFMTKFNNGTASVSLQVFEVVLQSFVRTLL